MVSDRIVLYFPEITNKQKAELPNPEVQPFCMSSVIQIRILSFIDDENVSILSFIDDKHHFFNAILSYT